MCVWMQARAYHPLAPRVVLDDRHKVVDKLADVCVRDALPKKNRNTSGSKCNLLSALFGPLLQGKKFR